MVPWDGAGQPGSVRTAATSATTSLAQSTPRDCHKTLTALAGAEPLVAALDAPVRRLQFFLSESVWDAEAVNARRLEVLWADAATAPHVGGALVIDETDGRKDGTKTAHVAPSTWAPSARSPTGSSR